MPRGKRPESLYPELAPPVLRPAAARNSEGRSRLRAHAAGRAHTNLAPVVVLQLGLGRTEAKKRPLTIARPCARRLPAPPARYNVAVDFTVRGFRREDFDTLWRIDQSCFPPGISYSRLELNVYIRRRGSFTLVATRGPASAPNADIVGFTVAESGRRDTGHIITIDVVAAARRSGVGSQLLRAAEERLRAAGCQTVVLETAVDNLSALAFYKRHGYSVVKTWPHYYSNGIDALVLEKDLAASKKDLRFPSGTR